MGIGQIKTLVKKNKLIYILMLTVKDTCIYMTNRTLRVFSGGGISYGTKRRIHGKNNTIFIGNGSIIRRSQITINGDNNEIKIGNNCHIGKGTNILIEGNNHQLILGDNTTITQFVHFCLQEHDTKIVLGKDCMLSNNIIIRTSDSHPIYDLNQTRLNNADSITIGDHVWICPHSTIMKGVRIDNNVIIASGALVTKNIPTNVMVGGMPAKIIKQNVIWTREKLW